MKVVFLGTPQIVVESLKYLIESKEVELIALVCPPDKPAGRGKKLAAPATKVCALENEVQVFQTKSIRKNEELIQKLKDLKPDFFVTFAFGQILSQEVIDIPKLGVINLHASLLPEYRGANPIQKAILDGKKTTGITTMLTDIGVDTGDMLIKKEIEITPNMTTLDLSIEVSKISPQVILETLKGLYNGTLKPIKQDEAKATHAAKVSKEDGVINWDKKAIKIHDKVRAFNPWPSTFANFRDSQIKIIETRIIEENKLSEKTGEILKISKEGIEVSTKDGIILITKIQPQGKKAMNAHDWANGARVQPKEIFS